MLAGPKMKLSLYTDDLLEAPADLLAVGVFADEPDRGLAYSRLNRALDGALERACRDERFKGEAGQMIVFNVTSPMRARRVLVYGYGERAEYGPHAPRRFAGAVARKARDVGAASTALVLTIPEVPSPPELVVGLMSALAEGLILGNYVFETYRTAPRTSVPLADARIAFAAEDVQGTRGMMLRDALARGRALAEATCSARDLVNEPANTLNPATLADRAKRMAKASDLDVKILGPRDLDRQKMGLLLGVARGSSNEPRLIHLTYEPEGKRGSRPVVVLVGKGLTYDAGGLSLKSTENMIEMKADMGGAAAVLGAMEAVAKLRPDCVVHGIVAAAENMPDGNAIRPSDILTSKKGLTVEVMNTDAEGRLALADALAYAQDLRPTDVIDVATLTGACVVALGKLTAGAWIADDAMAEDLEAAWREAGEKFWRMPLEQDLREQLDSDLADIKNLGERWGGAITAALFLQAFVGDVARWAHLDVAGPVLSAKAREHTPKGATGFAVRTLVHYVERRARR